MRIFFHSDINPVQTQNKIDIQISYVNDSFLDDDYILFSLAASALFIIAIKRTNSFI